MRPVTVITKVTDRQTHGETDKAVAIGEIAGLPKN